MISFLLKIWGLAKPYKVRLFLGVLTGIIGGVSDVLLIATVAFVFEIVSPGGGSEFTKKLQELPQFLREAVENWLHAVQTALSSGVDSHPWAVILLVATIPMVMLLRGLFSYLNSYFLQWVAMRAITDLRIRLFGHLMSLSAGFFNITNSGELMSRMMSDTATLQGIIGDATAVVVKDPVKLVTLLTYVLWQEPKLTMISMLVMPLCVVPILIYGRKIRRTAGTMQNHYAELSNVMSESFTGNRVIKAYNLEKTVVEQFKATARKLVGNQMRIVRSTEIPGPLMEFFGSVGVALVFLYLAFRGAQSGTSVKATDLGKLIASFFMMYQPIKNLARLQNKLEQARASSERVFELLATQTTIPEPINPKPLRAAGQDIQFAEIDFAFGGKPILQQINLTVKAGQFVALVGATGSGKTTLTNLLLRFYDPQRGAVRIGNTDIREVASRELRAQIAVVTQETVLFNDSIRQNIELGRPGATQAEIEAAARHAHAHEFIMEKPEGYDTLVGERGVTLSGGQRQRIAIARAIVRNAPILILDEATNSLDAKSEGIVQAALEELMQGRTTICIAHRLSTIQKADLIVVLDQGRIVETGRHAELLARDGIYRRLHDLQFRDKSQPPG